MDRTPRSCEDVRVKLKRLTVPVALAVTQLLASGCTTPSNEDAGACSPMAQADGNVQCVGGTLETHCIGPLNPCVVVAGDASPQCCELVG